MYVATFHIVSRIIFYVTTPTSIMRAMKAIFYLHTLNENTSMTSFLIDQAPTRPFIFLCSSL